jgi:hypothetical protein
MHLSADTLVDLAEGTRVETAEPHLQRCEACRQQVAELRAMMTAAADVDMPEPSPLFWEHLSERVRRDVAAEAAPRRFLDTSWLGASSTWKVAATVAAVAIVAVLLGRGSQEVRSIPSKSPAFPTVSNDALANPAPDMADDPSLALVVDLASQMDAEAVVESGLSDHLGGLDEMVVTLTAGERGELQRLLKDELAKS